jgi:transcriptional regulator with XRE-family HTH domain
VTLGTMLSTLRQKAGASMQSVAAALGLSSKTLIFRWEHDTAIPSAAQLARFLDAVGATNEERLQALALAGGPGAEAEAELEQGERPQGGPDTVVRHFDSDETILVPEGAADELDQLELLSDREDVGTGADGDDACTPISSLLRRRGAA